MFSIGPLMLNTLRTQFNITLFMYQTQSLPLSIQRDRHLQRAKKVVSDSAGLEDFAFGLVNSVFNLPDRQVIFLRNSNNRRSGRLILLLKKLLGLVEMTSGLVNVSFSLPKWRAIKMIFFAPCI